MAVIIAVAQHKGGAGKTTSTVNLGAALMRAGKEVLLIDLDPQANLTQSFGIAEQERNIYTALRRRHKLSEVIQGKGTDGIHIVPSTLDLTGAELELAGLIGREYLLRDIVVEVEKYYDYILIDCPPSLGLLTANALTAAHWLVIPLQAQYLAMQGLRKIMDVVALIQSGINKHLKVGGVFLTQYDGRKVLNRSVLQAVGDTFGAQVFQTIIRDNIALAEAPVSGQDVFRYAPRSKGAEDYTALAKEIMKVCK